MAEVSFIGKVKKYVTENKIYENIPATTSEDVPYISVNKYFTKPGMEIGRCIELDITKAYWFMAYYAEIISEEIFKEGLQNKNLSKKCLLISLGNLAKREIVYSFDGKQYSKPKMTAPPITSNCFFYVALCIAEFINKTRINLADWFVFYWVDALFFTYDEPKIMQMALDFFKESGFEGKIYFIDKIEVTKNGLFVYSEDWAAKHGEREPVRFFSFFKTKRKDVIESDITDRLQKQTENFNNKKQKSCKKNQPS